MKLIVILGIFLLASCVSSTTIPDESDVINALMDNSALHNVIPNIETRGRRNAGKIACRILYFTLPCFIYNQVKGR